VIEENDEEVTTSDSSEGTSDLAAGLEPELAADTPAEEAPSRGGEAESPEPEAGSVSREHLKGLLEALVFVSDRPVKANELAKSALAPLKLVRELLTELRGDYETRGIHLDEVAGGWIFRSRAVYAPFVRDVAMKKPVRLTRAQTETLAILAYRQPITRPEIDDIRGVDSGPILRLLLERDLVRILGRKDEPGRPVLYGTTTAFLEFFGLKSLKDLPTLREFSELSEDSRRVVERELGEVLEDTQVASSVPGAEDSPLSGARAEAAEPPASEAPEEGGPVVTGAAVVADRDEDVAGSG
jgi:segregation and condensation protein B